jgi:hypothetical protein
MTTWRLIFPLVLPRLFQFQNRALLTTILTRLIFPHVNTDSSVSPTDRLAPGRRSQISALPGSRTELFSLQTRQHLPRA